MLSCCMFIFLCYVGIMADLLLTVLKNKRFLFSNYFGLWTLNYFYFKGAHKDVLL